jgi:alkylation response protein AidB-like acyl-CoA dehydrogenase
MPASGEHEEFRRIVREWLGVHAVRRTDGPKASHGSGDEYDHEAVLRAKRFQRELHSAGLAGLSWPAEAGGAGLDPRYEIIFQQECADFTLPNALFNVGLGMCGPTIAVHGTPSQRQRWLGAILSGDDVWCQLFSEPDAGSDLAAVRSRAIRAEGGWIVDGQKIWTSHARFSDFGLALLRSDPARPKHRGLIIAVVDMHAPGVQIRPLKQMTGLSKFDQVFLDDVFVPDDQVLGGPFDGWRVARTTLSNERVAVGGNTALRGGTIAQVLLDAEAADRLDEPVLRQRLAQAWAAEAAIMLMKERVRRAILDGRAPGPEGALTKLASSSFVRLISSLGLDVGGGVNLAWDEGDDHGDAWSARVLAAPGLAIGGGTDEIVSTIVAERVLGLPREASHETPSAVR